MRDIHSIWEQNKRSGAVGSFMRWMVYRFNRVHLMEMADDPDPISLRNIYVDVRIGEHEVDGETMVGPKEAPKEELPGHDLWSLLLENDFLAISGLPGSGKTTLLSNIIKQAENKRIANLLKESD